MSDYKICVYAICKNESKFVEKWLDNMQEADYIVVLDTGSTDDTFKKLKADKRVTRVEQKIIKPWRFDVARNESMKLIPEDADILVCTDFDELFNKGWAKAVRAAWEQGQNRENKCNRLFYRYAWSHNEAGEPTDIFWYDKIHNRDFHWKFPVHEVLWPNDDSIISDGLKFEKNEVFLQHYQDQNKERHYYFDLLELSVEENPDDSHPKMLLAREYLLNKQYEKSLASYKAVLASSDVHNKDKRLVFLESISRCADIYRVLGDTDNSLKCCQDFIKEDPTYREPYFTMATIYNSLKCYTLAEACVNAALKYTTRKSNWIERANSWVSEADDILAIAYYNLGRYDEAITHGKIALEHHPDDVRLLKNYSAYLQAKLNETNDKIKANESNN